jgi:hypothetical protein
VDKTRSLSGDTCVKSVNLYPAADRSSTVELKFKSIADPKPYSAQVTVVSQEIVKTPWSDCSGDYQYVEASRLPGACVTARATPELLGQAVVSVALKSSFPEADGLSATLTTAEPTAAFLLSALEESARLAITARDPGNSGKTLTLDLPCRSETTDLASFREYGPQTTNVTVRFKDGAQAVQLEFLPECREAAEPIVLGFSASRASGQFSYFSTEIFRSRYRFRQQRDPETPWSEYRRPGEELVIEVSQTPEGVRLDIASADGGRNLHA